MDYVLNEQERDVRDLAEQIISKRRSAPPTVLVAPEDWLDQALWQDLADAGLLGIAVGEEHGGSGAGFVELCLVVEQAARAGARLFLLESVVHAAGALARLGTPAQQRLLAPFCAGTLVLSSALRTEPGHVPSLRVHRDGDGWRLDGAVGHVPLADVAERVLVEAVDDDGGRGLFLLDPAAAAVRRQPQSSVDRRPRWHLQVEGWRVPADDVLVAPGAHAAGVRWVRERAVAAACISLLGSCEAALALTASHVTERTQFGRALGSFQAVAHRVADAYLDVTAVRLTAWRAVWLLDQQHADEQEVTEALAIAACWATEAPPRVGEATMHLHGGTSVDLGYPLHVHYLALRQGALALGGGPQRLAELGDLVAVAQ
ncbi:acyl-CoA dehydrogenase family protein [Rhodococcus sp. X156]|uniref:acyl-CoA dehydrogenase family protein n=1 Tax=Rhodococcus sp. X156 TaxID=2499145 RepID=UPI0013E362EA|nr:acyl-CoA dehydrogenase family protein [Rhodococcus sp. X156]